MQWGMGVAGVYTTKKLADLFGIHSNTIRLYERLNYISPAVRGGNNYRYFGELHVLQVRVCRSVFGYPFFNKAIREASVAVFRASAERDYVHGTIVVGEYIALVENELKIARQTAEILQDWLSGSLDEPLRERLCYVPSEKPFSARLGGLAAETEIASAMSRKAAAAWLGTTSETVRNWERNALITAVVGADGRHMFEPSELEKMRIIYMLRLAGYSMAAVHHSLAALGKGSQESVGLLCNPVAEDVVMVGDHWIEELERLLKAAYSLPMLFTQMEEII